MCCGKAKAILIKAMNFGGKWKEENGGGQDIQLGEGHQMGWAGCCLKSGNQKPGEVKDWRCQRKQHGVKKAGRNE